MKIIHLPAKAQKIASSGAFSSKFGLIFEEEITSFC